jgi:anti-anti-sigma factor
MTERVVAVKRLPENLNVGQGGFLREMESCLKADRPRVVLDCSKLQRLDSAGIKVLLRFLEEAMKRNGDVKLACVPSGAAAILGLTRVDRLFEIFDTTAGAVNSFHHFPKKRIGQVLAPKYSAPSSSVQPCSFEKGHSDWESSLDSERTTEFSGRWLRWHIAGCLALLLIAPLAAAATSPQQETNASQQVSSSRPQAQDSNSGSLEVNSAASQPASSQPEVLPNSPLPNSPGTVRSQATDDDRLSSGQPPSPNQQENATQETMGTAAAPFVKTTGVAASRPAGAAIAPAKQRRARSILIKVSAIVGAGVAVGAVVALSEASPSRPSSSR